MNLGRTLMMLGLVIAIAGLAISFGDRLPLRLGRLPGDIYVRGKNSSFYFPLTTCLLLSALFSLLMWLFGRR